jgi:CubicO group peptidase (beta-lactamase class C family)
LAVADERTVAVDKLFARWDKKNSPGCALAIIKNGKIIYKRGYGMANLEHNIPISPKSVFYIGSTSKQFTAMCIALLAKQGKLSLDDDIQKYIPELPDYGTPITIRHLIHHTSGFRDFLALLDIAGIPFDQFHEEDVLELIVRQRGLNFKPGDRHLYTNAGYFLMSIIVKRVSGKTLREFADENIFMPLGMKNSRFHDDYTEIIKNRASGYIDEGKGKYKNFISTYDLVGGGGLFTSIEDLFLWDQDFYHCKVGGRDLINQFQTPGIMNNGEKLDYAFALFIGSYKGLKTVSHTGSLKAYRAQMIRFPEQNFSVICLSNLSTFNPSRLCYKVVDIYLADHFTEEKTETGIRLVEKIKFINFSEKKLKEKVGAYFQPDTGEIRKLFIKDGKLIFRVYDQNYPLAALNETEFQVLESPVNVVIKFEKQGKEKPLLMHVYQEGANPATFQSFKLVKPTLKQLREYTGDYYSEELKTTLRLILKEEKLYFAHKNASQTPLRPILRDMFSVKISGIVVKNLIINLIRDEKGKIFAFNLNTQRVKNLQFTKK